MENDINITRPDNFDELNQRSAHPTAWLDEILQAIELALEDAVNKPTCEEKNKVLLASINYIGGIMEGNRFMRENPYKNSKPLTGELLKKIMY